MKTRNFLFIIFFTTTVFSAGKSTVLQPPSPAPTFSLPTPSMDRISLRVFCGDTLQKPHINNTRHIVVLSFWATYCKPCKKELPELMKFAKKHTADSIKVFAVSIDKEGSSIVAPFVKENNITLPVLFDQYRKTAERYGVTSLPALFVVDERGIIRFSSVGFDGKEPLDEKLDAIVGDLRSGKAVSRKQSSEAGESVAVDSGASTPNDSTTVIKAPLSPKDRWNAIVAVECGTSLEQLADSLKVTPEEIKGWYADLKKAAMGLWEKEKK
ncbi:MAG: TlpA family protein disulfide reductase [Chitinispirillaceae bacterium]|nr:TlpA family protein disulfide reductase [Chitinispirillaceae bacterium]